MKQIINLLVVAIIAMMSVSMESCSGSSSSDKERIAQLEDSIAKLNQNTTSKVATPATSTTSDNYMSESHSSSSSDNASFGGFESQESKNPNNTIVGTYEFSDNLNTWVLVVGNDETAYIYNKKGGEDAVKAYGSWYKYSHMKAAAFKFSDKAPIVWFQSGEETLRYPYLTEKWIYYNSSAADAKNPEKRLSVKKVK